MPAEPALPRLLLAAAVAGSLDLAYAFALNAAAGVSPRQVLQFIASGLLGGAAFSGGWTTALLGLLLHFGIMLVFVCTLYVALGRLPWFAGHIWLAAFLCGSILYAVMNWLVMPLSLTPALAPVPVWRTALEYGAHVVLVGLPAVWMLSFQIDPVKP